MKTADCLLRAVALLLIAVWVPTAMAQDKKLPSTSSSPAPVATQVETNKTQPASVAAPVASPETAPTQASAPSVTADEPLPFAMKDETEQGTATPSAGGLLVRTLGALLLIVGLIVAAGWGLRRFGGAKFGKPAEDAPELAVLTSVSLGDRRSLAVIRFGDRNFLIGSTAQSVSLLATEDAAVIDEPELEQAPVARSVADLLQATDARDFASELADASKRVNADSVWTEDGGRI